MQARLIIRIFLLLFFLFSLAFSLSRICTAQIPQAAKIQRSQELLDSEAALREKLKAEKKYIAEIIVQGASKIPAEKIKALVLPFQKHLLTKNEIEEIIDLIRQAYQEKAFLKQPKEISYEIKHEHLMIQVKE